MLECDLVKYYVFGNALAVGPVVRKVREGQQTVMGRVPSLVRELRSRKPRQNNKTKL